MHLENGERFQLFCARLVRREFPTAMPLAFASWDGGRDIVQMMQMQGDQIVHGAVWQAKFTDSLDSTTKRAIRESIDTIRQRPEVVVRRWILCMPVDPTGVFLDWLAGEVPSDWKWEVWGETILLEKLEKNPDIIESFFYPVYEQLRRIFMVEQLELVRFQLDEECQWHQFDPQILHFGPIGNVVSPDLVLDVIVRNTGRLDSALLAIEVQVFDWEIKPHGVPGEGLLFPQYTYRVSIRGGEPGKHRADCEPPLVIKGESLERFKIRVTDTGYSWRGNLAVTLDYGIGKRLRLPVMRLLT
jgi:hypothetical protein